MAAAMAAQDGSAEDLNRGVDSEARASFATRPGWETVLGRCGIAFLLEEDPWRLPALEELEAAQEIELNGLVLESKQECFHQETSWGRKAGAAVDLNHGMDLEEARCQRRRRRRQEMEQNDLDATQELITLKDSWSNRMMTAKAKAWALWALRRHKEPYTETLVTHAKEHGWI